MTVLHAKNHFRRSVEPRLDVCVHTLVPIAAAAKIYDLHRRLHAHQVGEPEVPGSVQQERNYLDCTTVTVL